MNFDPNTSMCITCEPPLEWDVVGQQCACPPETVLQPSGLNRTVCCSISYCAKSSDCCSGYCSNGECTEPLPPEKISPFDPKSPFALLFWLLALACSSAATYVSYSRRSLSALFLFVLFPFVSAFLISPFAGFSISVAELFISLLLSARDGTRKATGRAAQQKSKRKAAKQIRHEEGGLLDMPPPESGVE
jgi:hypothetical protein